MLVSFKYLLGAVAARCRWGRVKELYRFEWKTTRNGYPNYLRTFCKAVFTLFWQATRLAGWWSWRIRRRMPRIEMNNRQTLLWIQQIFLSLPLTIAHSFITLPPPEAAVRFFPLALCNHLIPPKTDQDSILFKSWPLPPPSNDYRAKRSIAIIWSISY